MNEPIAVVGMACKFPGAPDLASFWKLLESGGNAITQGVPGSGVGRIGQFYPESAKQNPACHYAALIDGIDLFDAEFFRVSPVEAQLLDPQQRILLETCWTALEDALVDPEQLKGSRTGVFIGISNNDYRSVSLDAGQPTEAAASLYTVSGTSFNTAAGRVAFALGLQGPAMAVDTACSSSLFALHQAVASLQRDEADMILVGGVQAIFLGQLTELRARAGMLSPDGQCKAFDASANGFVRGEGCGIVVLKRLKDAQSDGDRVWGTVLGSAVNQDGTSTGLTVPSGPAQEQVIEQALVQAGLQPHEVDYLEAHGTGTPVGDPIELNAAAKVYGKGRPAELPLLVGSVKTNVGHLEPAAGVAGLMKVLLAMHRGLIPKHLHFDNPNPAMDWDRLPVRITSETTAWPVVPDRPFRAGISSYGWSGTNVHVLVEGHPGSVDGETDKEGMPRPAGPARTVPLSTPALSGTWEEVQEVEPRPARFLPLSGRSEAAVRDLARGYANWLDEQSKGAFNSGTASDSCLSDMAWTASVARSHFSHRAGVVFRDAHSLRSGLEEVANSYQGIPPGSSAKVAFVFTGQGSQWSAMGEALYQSEPVFRAVLDRCDLFLYEERGASLLDVMFARPGADDDLDEPRWTQPAIYALECALTALWASVGIRPDVVLGHSMGEIAAAHAAGVLSLEDGLRFASARGRLLGALPRRGAMAAVFAPRERVAAKLQEWNDENAESDLCIGVDNGTHQVISGPAEEVEAFSQQMEASGVNLRSLRASPAYHSPLVEPALDDLEGVFTNILVALPEVPLVSNLTGRPIGAGEQMDGQYWRRHARQPVTFRSCVETLAELGVGAVVELGPHAILGPLVSLNWPEKQDRPEPPVVMQSLMRPASDGSEPERADAFVQAVARAYEIGLPVDLKGMFAGEERRKVSVPGYPFQRRRYWVGSSQRRKSGDEHPLLGTKHESPRGEVMFETEMFPSEPSWLGDHMVFDRVVMPGALYGSMAAAVPLAEGAARPVVEDLQLHSPLVYPEHDRESGENEPGRRIQLVVDASNGPQSRHFEIYSKGPADDGWTLHAEGKLAPRGLPGLAQRADLAALRNRLQPQDLQAYYRAKSSGGIDFGPSFRTVEALWCAGAEAVGEVALQDTGREYDLAVHPLLLDGCFQVLSATRSLSGLGGSATYLPFGWERLRLNGPLPSQLICHAKLRNNRRDDDADVSPDQPPETLTGDLWLYSTEGVSLGELTGFTLKRATRAAFLSGTESLQDMLYETIWRERPLAGGLRYADALILPSSTAAHVGTFAEYLVGEGVEIDQRTELLADLERLARSYALAALNRLGWHRERGAVVHSDSLQETLHVIPEHARLLGRMLRLQSDAGVLSISCDGSYIVSVGSEDPLPDEALADPETFADRLLELHPHGASEIGLLRRSGGALAEVLLGETDPLSILFRSEGPGAAEFYFTAPASRASNRLLGDTVAAAVEEWPADRRLRILEVGSGTGSGTSVILPKLPTGSFDYMYTDISAGFFAEAEDRFRDSGAPIEYRTLDIERDPASQGFSLHAYDLVIAVNVLHATRDLGETLSHCRDLLAPSGQIMALENLKGRGWQDMTFGQLDGWWRFSDSYRPDHALAPPGVWLQALADYGFEDSAVLGGEGPDGQEPLGSGMILAQGPAKVVEPGGVWVLVADEEEEAYDLASRLASRNQTVILAGESPKDIGTRVAYVPVEPASRESWLHLLQNLPKETPLQGVVHCNALSGHGPQATTEQLADDVRKAGASALALVQAIQDSGITPAHGIWFLTKGAQALEQDYMRNAVEDLAGTTLWGFGKAVSREAPYLQPKMIDLDPVLPLPSDRLVDELLYPDEESHVAYRSGRRLAARLVRSGKGRSRLSVPEEGGWRLFPTSGEGLEGLHPEDIDPRPLEKGQVRVAVEAAGLNFSDVLISMGAVEMDPMLGDEFCGRITEVGPGVSGFGVGDRVLGLGIGTFGPEAITNSEMVAPAPSGYPAAALATIPTSFVSAELAYQISGLNPGDRVLIHTASGGVGLAAIQMARAAGAEVYATASSPKQDYLRSMGIAHIFDSRSTAFAKEVLEATEGAGVSVVLNSLTGPGFIEASLECLAPAGRFVELGRRDIWTEDKMAEVRPDVAYSVLQVDQLKRHDPAVAGESLRRVMQRLSADELKPLAHTRWPMAEVRSAMEFMGSARHIGKNVITIPPLENGRLRADRTYLVTGGLGGIGRVVAGWLADRGAGVIVLNGRRPPDMATVEAIEALRQRGADVRVELADLTDPTAIDAMLSRMDADLPPLAGVVHSVGVLSDGSLTNQTWERFEEVLWPKVLGAWHLHQATLGRDLDLFILFSSVTGVLGNSGQGNHAAANAFLDQLAGYRRSLGLPGQSIAWGAWSGLGEAEEQRERIERQLAASGTGWISPQQGLKAFDELVRQGPTAAMVAEVDWSVLAENLEDKPSFLEELLSEQSVQGGASGSDPDGLDLLSQLSETTIRDWEGLLTSFVGREVQAVLRMPTPPVPTVGFFDLGMDSLMSVELRNRLNRALSGKYVVSNTSVFDYPNVAALAGHLSGELSSALGSGGPEMVDAPVAPQPRSIKGATSDPVAIVGMACRFPGAPDLSLFWELLETGEIAVTDGRKDEGDWAGVTGDPAADDILYRRGGFVEGIDLFDNSFFRISPIEARMMDPQHRMLLETTWHALEDAGMDPEGLKGSQTGVYVGIGGSEYRDVISSRGLEDLYFGTSGSIAAGRVAFVLGLEGPAMPVDMACASSLAALHQAAVALQRGDVNMALAGGVNATLSPAVARFHHDMGMLSPTGMCNAFDASADGFVRGEGCGMVVLKRLSDAEADGDRVWGLIRGSAVNQNGASAALPVPRGPAQERLIREALDRAGVSPSDVDYLEAHGTGTELGDSIELRAVAAVYGEGREPGRPLLVGSVKPNIGHAEWAAGMASLMKAVLAMKRGMIPPHLNFREPNPNFDWDRMPVRVTSEATEWPVLSNRLPLSAVNSFGLSGTNAHMILEGYDGPADVPGPAGQPTPVTLTPFGELPESQSMLPKGRARLLPLSGKSHGALRDLAKSYLSWLNERSRAPSLEDTDRLLADMAWTAGVGRSHFPCRAGLIFGDAAELEARLSALVGLVEASDGLVPPSSANVAFVYTGQGGMVAGMGEALYRTSPAARAVLDRCGQVMRDDRGVSLLDVMSGSPGLEASLRDPEWEYPALYAIQAAITALWGSVGVKPGRVVGRGAGEVAAAQAAGLFSLEDGCRLAGSLAGPELAMPRMGTASSTWISNVLQRAVLPSDELNGAHWRGLSDEDHASRTCMNALAQSGTDLVVVIGPGPGTAVSSYWPQDADGGPSPVFLESLLNPDDEPEAFELRFLEAVAAAYEAGARISFAGLFVGEERRRISIPGYPFQRRRFWVQGRGQG